MASPSGGWLFREGFLFDKNELKKSLQSSQPTYNIYS